jgi:class 3 adenylate cyclase/hemoglobin-like flavoprotein
MPATILFAEAPDAEVSIAASAEGTLLDAILARRLPLLHDCGGNARCTTCRVRVLDGLANLSPRTPEEAEIAQTYAWPEDVRLACQANVLGDVRVEPLVHHDNRHADGGNDPSADRSEERHLAVLFCDVTGFTDFASGQMPYDVVHVVNRLFLKIGEAVLANTGYIDKYLGDGLLALWGMHGGTTDASTCLSAVRAGLLMQKSIREVSGRLSQHFGSELSLRVGIHFGRAIVGRIGHPARQQVTAIGDTVNIAARVEAANKDLRTGFLVTEELYEHVANEVVIGDDFKTVLRGQSRPRRLFEVTGLQKPDAIFIAQSHLTRIGFAGEEFVRRFYRNLFELKPALQQLFDHISMPQQHVRFLEFFSWAIRELRHTYRLRERLAEVGARHSQYGVRPEHYETAGAALLAAIAETLAADFDDAARQAWTEVFAILSRGMQP